MRIFLTGATGFIGGHVLSFLNERPDYATVAASRSGAAGTCRLDLRDPCGLARALAGIDAVVHCAVGDRAVTVEGTRALLRAAADAGVRRVVHLSSVAVYRDPAGAVREDWPLVPARGDGYANHKAAAEQACLQPLGLDVVRLRPTIVYGAGSRLWVEQMARRLRAGRWGLFGEAGEGTCSLVHVSDVAAAVVAALSAPRAAGMAFNIDGPASISWNAWFARLAAAIGAPPPRPVAPARLRLRSRAALPLKAVARLRPGFAADWLLGAPAASELTLFATRAHYPTDAAERTLGWRPRRSIEEGLADSAAWVMRGERAA